MTSRRISLVATIAATLFTACGNHATTADTPTFTSQPTAISVVSHAAATFAVTATGNGTLSYQWRKDGAALPDGTSANLSLASVDVASAGVYDCVVTNTVGSDARMAVSDGAALAVNVAPTIVVQPLAQSIAVGGQVIFVVAASGNGLLGYQWKKDGVDILDATHASYSIPAVAASDSGAYSCVVTNTVGDTHTSTPTTSAALTVASGPVTPPVITTSPSAVTVGLGDAAAFSVVATGSGALAYQWRKDGAAVSGANNATLSLASVASSDAGLYDCVVTNTVGGLSSMAVSASARLTVNGPPVILAQPLTQTVVLQGTATSPSSRRPRGRSATSGARTSPTSRGRPRRASSSRPSPTGTSGATTAWSRARSRAPPAARPRRRPT